MSEANLNIWITRKGHPCEIDNNPNRPAKPGDPIQLFVYVLHCNGEILEWCGKRYVGMQAKCGHLALTVPPGCYIVGAVENPHGFLPGHHLGNHLTHISIVRVNCGDHACVTLFNPTFHFCGHWFLTAIRDHLAGIGAALPNNIATALRRAETSVKALVATIPQDPFTANQARDLDTSPKPEY